MCSPPPRSSHSCSMKQICEARVGWGSKKVFTLRFGLLASSYSYLSSHQWVGRHRSSSEFFFLSQVVFQKPCLCYLVFLSVGEGRVVWGKGGSSGEAEDTSSSLLFVFTLCHCPSEPTLSSGHRPTCHREATPHAYLPHCHLHPLQERQAHQVGIWVHWLPAGVGPNARTTALPSDPGPVSQALHLLPVWAQP